MVTPRAGQRLTSLLSTADSDPRECGSVVLVPAAGLAAVLARGAVISISGRPPSLRTMATDSWALAVDEQEAAVKSVSGSSSSGEGSRRAQADRASNTGSPTRGAGRGPTWESVLMCAWRDQYRHFCVHLRQLKTSILCQICPRYACCLSWIAMQ